MADGTGVRSGRYIGEDGQVYNLVDLLGSGAAPVDGMVKNIDEYSPRSGRVIGEDGQVYNVVDLIAAKQAEINNSIGAAVEPVASQLADIANLIVNRLGGLSFAVNSNDNGLDIIYTY
jgi:hypothetical protein